MGYKSETNLSIVEQNNFEYIFGELQKQLLKASVHFDIVEKLWPTEQTVDIINRYIGFFGPTREAHFDRFILKISDSLSSSQKSPTFYRVLKMISNNPDLALKINVQEIKRRLKNHRAALKAITNYRNTRVAHWDTTVSETESVLYGNSRRLLEELKDIFNEINASHSKSVLSFRYSQQGDTINLLETLKRQLAQDQEKINNLQRDLK